MESNLRHSLSRAGSRHALHVLASLASVLFASALLSSLAQQKSMICLMISSTRSAGCIAGKGRDATHGAV
jgi:hypothetical protein